MLKKITEQPCITQKEAHPVCEPNLHVVAHHSNARDTEEKNRLPSLEEVIQIITQSVPNRNDFNGYLRPPNFAKDRENFLKTFEMEMGNVDYSVQYVRNKLVFNYPGKKSFNPIYQFHMIVYK